MENTDMEYSNESVSSLSSSQRNVGTENTRNVARTLPATVDGIAMKPNISYQDKLWTEIDVLDDVKRMANENNLYNGFPPDFENQLGQLRRAHVSLLQTMKEGRERGTATEKTEDGENGGTNVAEQKQVQAIIDCLNGLRN